MKTAILTSQQENQWIAMSRKGDLSAFNQLVLAYQDLLFRMALWMLNDEEGAADAVQAALLTAYQEISNFRGDTFRSWLLKMVRNACMDELRRRKRHPWLPLEPQDAFGKEIETASRQMNPGLSQEEALMQHEGWERIEQVLRELPEPMREVIALIDNEDLDYEEASIALGIPLGTVKSRLARARRCLRKIFRREHPEQRWQPTSVPGFFPKKGDVPE